MEVTVETTEGLERRMSVQVPAARLDDEVSSRLQNLARTVRLDGFRPGKVPLKVVEKRFGGQVRSEVLNEVVQQTYGEALQEKELNPAGSPQVEVKQGLVDGDLQYEAVFEVMPEVQVQGLDTMTLERPVAEVTDEDVDRVLHDLQKQRAEYETVDRAATDDDRVIVDFQGQVDGEEFPGSHGEDQPVTIGSGTMPPEFETALKGLKAGDEKDIEYSFGEDFPTQEIAGKTAVFKTRVKEVQEPRLPELDDEFASGIGLQEGGLQGLRDLIKKNLGNEATRASKARLKEQVTEHLVQANDMTLPKALVDGEIQALQQQMKQRLQQQTGDADDRDLPAEIFEGQARRRVTLGLVMNRLISDNNIKLDADLLRQRLQEMAAGYDQPEEVVKQYSQNRQLMQSLEINVLEDQVVDWAVEQATVSDVSMSLEDLLNPSRRAGRSEETADDETSEDDK